MKLFALGYALLLSAVTMNMVRADTATLQPYTCETDKDCDQHFTNTVCITVDNYGVEVKKCTPNTKARPACRGAQPGMCPSYQSAEVGYLNLQCVFVADDGETMAGSTGGATAPSAGSGSSTVAAGRRRFLLSEITMANTTPAATTKAPAPVASTTKPPAGTVAPSTTTDSSSSKSTDVDVGSAGSAGSASSADDEPGPSPKPSVTVLISKVKVTGHFTCLDVSDCENKAYDPTSCLPKECGPSGSLEQCNTHGTCTFPSVQTMSKRRCMCQKGFGGEKCQTEISGQCDVDCGIGGDCVDGMCKCKKGFDGKNYKGKAGKPNRRCTKCTNDQACQNSNSCDIETGSCACSPGYSGITCGATEDGCTKLSCGTVGKCQVVANGTGVCYCPLCTPTCEICKTKDCSTCPSLASSIGFSKAALLLSAIVAVLVSNFA